jgi:hypothetical protein
MLFTCGILGKVREIALVNAGVHVREIVQFETKLNKIFASDAPHVLVLG